MLMKEMKSIHKKEKKTEERLTKAQVGQEGSVLHHLEVRGWRSMGSLIYGCLIVFFIVPITA